MMEQDNIGTWDENKRLFVEMYNDVKYLRTEFPSFKGRVIGTVIGISAGISIIITILTLIIGQNGMLK